MIFLALLAAAPVPGTLTTIRDWTVGCDNGRACQAVALLPEGDQEGHVSLVISRPAGNAPPAIRVAARDAVPAALLAGGRRTRLAGGKVAPRDLAAVIAAVNGSTSITVLDARDRRIGVVSVSGATAALLYIDDRQGRIGTAAALVRPGARPARAVPPPPPLPVVLAPRPSRLPPARLSPADARRFGGDTSCGAPAGEPQAVRLDARTTLVLVPQPCDGGAYNLVSSPVIVDGGRPRLADFDANIGMSDEAPPAVVNAAWNAQSRRLETFIKARGLGDCGARQSFAWDGKGFRLVERAEMGECRGSTDYITTWRARVVAAR